MAKKTKSPNFESALRELEDIVARMEQGDIPLEDALRQFERGIALTRTCQQALRDAEQKVQILLKDSDTAEPEDFASDSEPDEDPART